MKSKTAGFRPAVFDRRIGCVTHETAATRAALQQIPNVSPGFLAQIGIGAVIAAMCMRA